MSKKPVQELTEEELDNEIADLERELRQIQGDEEFEREQQEWRRKIDAKVAEGIKAEQQEIKAEEREEGKEAELGEKDGVSLGPPPTIDPAQLEAIPEVKSLKEGQELMDALDRNIELVEGREALAQRARQFELLKLANGAPRCRHLKVDGRGCGSPAIRGHDYCYYHDQMRSDPVDFTLIVEDLESLHISYQRLMRDIRTGVISDSRAKLLLQVYQAIAKDLLRNDTCHRKKPRRMDG